MLMRVLRVCTLVLTAVMAVVFVIILITSTITQDRTKPTIKVPDSVLEVSVNATEEELLRDITAYDKKDGDITSRLLVESISRFTDVGYCKITYAACDYDNHVVTASRQLHYTDYTPPKFTVNRSPVFSIYDDFQVTGLIGATDCIDGNISQNVIIYSPDFQEDEEGVFTIEANVTNSKGDSAEISLPIIVEKISRGAPTITLDKYLVYLDVGSTAPDWLSFIKEMTDSTGIDTNLTTSVKSDIDMTKAGVYVVNIYGTDEFEKTGHTAVIAVVK